MITSLARSHGAAAAPGSGLAPCVDDLDGLSDADDPDALMLADGQKRLVPGDDEIGLGGKRGADDHIVIRIGSASAAYDANMAGQLEGFYIYADVEHIYFRLKIQPARHYGCNPNNFVFPTATPADRRKAILARLSLAFALQETVNIGYAANADCSDGGYIKVYRVG